MTSFRGRSAVPPRPALDASTRWLVAPRPDVCTYELLEDDINGCIIESLIIK